MGVWKSDRSLAADADRLRCIVDKQFLSISFKDTTPRSCESVPCIPVRIYRAGSSIAPYKVQPNLSERNRVNDSLNLAENVGSHDLYDSKLFRFYCTARDELSHFHESSIIWLVVLFV